MLSKSRVLLGAVRASAVIAGRTCATPDDVERLVVTAMAHRLVCTTEATVEGVQPGVVVRNALIPSTARPSRRAPEPGTLTRVESR